MSRYSKDNDDFLDYGSAWREEDADLPDVENEHDYNHALKRRRNPAQTICDRSGDSVNTFLVPQD